MVAAQEDVEVVISGIGGYFPRSKNVEELQKVLMDQIECCDDARWKAGQLDVCDKTGNVEQAAHFDASYFGIHRKQSFFMDPMQRMLLQNTLEALIDAGTTPIEIRGRRVLVATASSLSENDSLMFENVENGFGVTGQARAMVANRISYWLNITGPSYSCDASWLGGFQVLDHAYHAIRSGQCEAAIVGASNLAMNIYPQYQFMQMKVISPDGHTRSFNEDANGYTRSDGLCVLYLQRGDQARRRYATLMGVNLLFNGCRSGQFVSMDLDVARRFLTDFYQRAGVHPTQVNYVEGYGSADKLLDKLELNLFDQVFNDGNRTQPLMVGSVKTNVGHSEASSALISIVKVIIAMETGIIPANLHCNTPRTDIPALADGSIKLVSEHIPFSGSLAAVNGFGICSSYGHALLRRNSVEKRPDVDVAAQKLPLLHILSTRTEDGIKQIMEKVKAYEEFNMAYMNLINGVFTTHIPGYFYRGYVLKPANQTFKEETALQTCKEETAIETSKEETAVQTSKEEISDQTYQEETADQTYQDETADQTYQEETADQISKEKTAGQTYQEETADQTYQEKTADQISKEKIADQASKKKTAGQTCKEESAYYNGASPPVWFVYSGMGSQWLGMGKALLDLPVFARAVQRCAAALQPFGVNLIHILTSDDPTLFDNILYSFVGIAAVQIGLTDILTALDITPDGIVGHSVGELGCAYIDGCLTAEQMVLSAYFRGRASQEATLIPGLMAAVGMGATEAAQRVSPGVDIACHNGPDSCTVSGPEEEMEVLVKELKVSGVFARLVNVAGIAYHSRYIRPAAPLLLEYLNKLIPEPKERSSKWLSTSVPQQHWNTKQARCASSEYLTNNLLSSVYFEETMKNVPKGAVIIEIAPHGLLQAILKRSMHPETENIALTKRGFNNGLEFLFTAIGKIYLSGIKMNLPALYENTYPMDTVVPRGTPSLASLVRWSHSERWRTGLDEFKDYSSSEQTFNLDIHGEWFRDVLGHRVCNSTLIPMTTYLPLVCLIMSNIKKVDAVQFSNITVKRHRTLPVRDEYVPPVRVMVLRGMGLFEVSDRYGDIVIGEAIIPDQQELQHMLQEIDADKGNIEQLGEELYKLNADEVYWELATRGLELSGMYRTITDLCVFKNGVKASIIWKNNWAAFIESLLHTRLIHPTVSTRHLTPGFIRRLAICFERQPPENSVLQVCYCSITDTLCSSVVYLAGAKSIAPTDVRRPTQMALATRFMSHQIKEEKQDLTIAADVVLQITEKTLKKEETELHVIVCNDVSTRTIRNILNKASKENTKPKLHLHVFNAFGSNKLASLPDAALLVVSSQHLKDAQQYLQHSPNTHLLVCSQEVGPLTKSNLMEVLTYQTADCQLRLLKQLCNEKPVIVNINETVINNGDLANNAICWVDDLRLKLSLDSIKRVYLTCRSLPTNDVSGFVNAVRLVDGGHKVRFVFILDKNAPEFTVTEKFYSHVFQQDLTVLVYERGQWGCRYTNILRITNRKLIEDEKIVDQQVSSPDKISIKMNNVDVRYIGIHATSVVPVENDRSGTTPKLGLVDYCGIQGRNENKVMGICDGRFVPDPTFQWPLPDDWTLVDGATVPAAYTLAYYVLVERTNLQAGESVLIHNACSAIGQAMIRIAYDIGAQIFASVATERQKALLLSHMRMLCNETVFDLNTAKFEQQVMYATQGEGIRVIVNCVRGERLRAGLRCVAPLGRVVLLQDETDSNIILDNIGLSTFFRCVGMYGVHPSRLCDLSNDTKKHLHQLVKEGLKNGAVKPIRRNIFRHQEPLDQVFRYVTGPQVTGCAVVPIIDDCTQIQPQPKSTFQCDSSSTYVIFVGDTDDIQSVNLTVTWLAKHCARKVTLVANQRLNIDRGFLQRQLRGFNTHVELVKTLPSPEKLKNVAGIIVLPGVKGSAAAALPTGVRLVVCIGTSTPLSPSCNSLRSTLRWDKKSRYMDVTHFLGYALSQTLDIVVVGDEAASDQIVEETFTYKDFFRLLAESMSSVTTAHSKSVDSVSMEMLTSAGPRQNMQLTPLFLLPGLLGDKCRYLQQTIRKLMCPVIVVRAMQKSQTIEQLSAEIAKRIREAYTSPYNIAGVSTGGVLALDVAKHLEEAVGSSNVQLYLLDAAPTTLQHLVHEAQTNNHAGVDGVVLQYLVTVGQPEGVVSELVTRQKTWEARMNAILNLANFTREETQQVTQALNMIRNRINQMLNYTPNERMLHAPVRLLRPSESCKDFSRDLMNTCKQLKVQVIKGNHFTMLQSQSLADYINDNYIVKPIYT